MDDGKPWFAQKRYGYGAGLPIAWQGWAVLGAWFLALLTGIGLAAWDEDVGLIAGLALIVPATAALIYASAIKTRGGWRWRWGARPRGWGWKRPGWRHCWPRCRTG